MEASELRIGNLVKVENDYEEVVSIKGDAVVCRLDKTSDGVTQSIKDINPILLTEEWLVRFGIIKKNFTDGMPEELQQPDVDEDGGIWYSWVKGAFNLEIQENGEIWFEVYSHYIHVKYVHQLQNLYFALTEEELELQ